MKRQTPVAHLLYSYLFPQPHPSDPPSFSAHLARNLVPEVRIEVATFYGDLNSTEARYPGLNYCHRPHRMRLGRFKHHKRLFEAFDHLGLTYGEIQDFCCWEGTKWARERYEKDEGVKVVDTTGDEIGPFVDRRDIRAAEDARRNSITRKTDISIVVEDAETSRNRQPTIDEDDEDMDDVDSETDREESADVEADTEQETASEETALEQHVGDLQRRRQLARERTYSQRIIAAWEQGQTLPPDLEQYLKEQSERGNHFELNRLMAQRRASRTYSVPDNGALVANVANQQASQAAA